MVVFQPKFYHSFIFRLRAIIMEHFSTQRIVRNQCRTRRKYILTTLFLSLFVVFVHINFWKPDQLKQENSVIFMDAVVLSQRGISSGLSPNPNHTTIVEALRKKTIRRFGVLATRKPGLQGFVNVHMWLDLCGTDLLTLKYFPLFPNVPSTRQLLPGLDITQLGSSYGKRVFGYLVAPTSGKYSFQLTASGSAEFWLSTDDKPHNNRRMFCLEKGKTSASGEVHLRNFQWYYFEILHKHGRYQWFDYILLEWKIGKSDYSKILPKYLRSYQNDRAIRENVVNVDSFVQPGLEIHLKQDKTTTDSFEAKKITRETIYKLPFISADLIKDLFPYCAHKPDYLVTYKLARYGSKWENIYAATYPSDETNLTDVRGVIRFGNDVLEEGNALKIVQMVMTQFKLKKLR